MNQVVQHQTPRAGRGFTLIELLVVVSIVTLLIAIIFPVFAAVRRNGRMTMCASNLHQLGLALQMYEGDFEGKLPPHEPFYPDHFLPEGGYDRTVPYDPLKPYVHSSAVNAEGDGIGIYRCPEQGAHGGNWSYQFRFLINMAKDHPFVNDPYLYYYKHVSPKANTVVASCGQHIAIGQGPPTGQYIVLRENGAVQRIGAKKVVRWIYKDGTWSPTSLAESLADWNNGYDVFPDESWPPDLYCDVGACRGLTR